MSNPVVRRIVEIVSDIVSASSSDGRAQLHEPEFTGREREYVLDAIDSTFVSSVGAYVDRFEAQLAEACGVERAVAVVNGTAALHASLVLAGVTHGDEVLVPALTFIATANAVSYCGAIPRFVDVAEGNLGMDPVALAAHLEAVADRRDGGAYVRESGRRIAAMVPMHAFGLPCDIDGLLEVARSWGIPLVEDAAESLGSTMNGRPLGGRGFIGATSFNGNKIITTGGGGAILTNDPELGRTAKHLTTTAKVPHRWEFIHDRMGYNYRLPNINAALGVSQLERLPEYLAEKRALAAAYRAAFAGLEGVTFVDEPAGSESNFWLNAIRVESRTIRDEVLSACNEVGLMTRPVWTLMTNLDFHSACPRAELSVSHRIEDTLINIPSSPRLGRPFRALA